MRTGTKIALAAGILAVTAAGAVPTVMLIRAELEERAEEKGRNAEVTSAVTAETTADTTAVTTAETTAETTSDTTAETTAETTRAAMARRCHAHACNCGYRRNENLVELHVVTSFFFGLYMGVGDVPPRV